MGAATVTADRSTARRDALDALATLLEYPGDGFAERARAAGAALAASAPRAVRALDGFLRRVREADAAGRTELEETYSRTFDWNPERCLEIGWHLFGERYERGAFLVRMREGLRGAGVEEGTELPDHLGAALRLLGRLPDADAAAFVREAVPPALEKVVAGFASVPDNPYADVVRAVRDAVRDVPGATDPRPAPPPTRP